jgi:hypothetical protein
MYIVDLAIRSSLASRVNTIELISLTAKPHLLNGS